MKLQVLLAVLFLSFTVAVSAEDFTYSSNQMITLREPDRAIISTDSSTHTVLIEDYIENGKVALIIDGTYSDDWVMMGEGDTYPLSGEAVLRVTEWTIVEDEIRVTFVVSEPQELIGTEPPIPVPQNSMYGPSEEEIEAFARERERKDFLFNVAAILSVLVTLLLGIVIAKKMVRKNSLVLNWVLHSIFALGSLAIFVPSLVDGIRCFFSVYCSDSFLVLSIAVTALFSSASSWYVLRCLRRDPEGKRHVSNLSGSIFFMWLIFPFFILISELIVRPNYDLPVSIFSPIIITPVMLVLYSILVIIGSVIDKKKSLS